MNGSNSLSETDAEPMHLCPLCQRKLAWNIGFDTTRQYEKLEAFYRKHLLTEEAEWMAGRVQRWKKVDAAERIKKTTEE